MVEKLGASDRWTSDVQCQEWQPRARGLWSTLSFAMFGSLLRVHLTSHKKQSNKQKQDQGVTQHLHEQVPGKTNTIYSLNSQQVFTACLPRPGTVLGPENTMAIKANKRPSLMELAFK